MLTLFNTLNVEKVITKLKKIDYLGTNFKVAKTALFK